MNFNSDKLNEKVFFAVCKTIDIFLKEFGMTGVYAAFAVGAALAHDLGLTGKDIQEIFDFMQKSYFDAKETEKDEKNNVVDITSLLNKKKL